VSRVREGLHRLRYFVSDAWDEWHRSPGVNLLAVATLASTLFLAALVILVIVNVERRVRILHDEISVQVYLRDGLSAGERRGLEEAAAALEGVRNVEYVSKAEARRRYKEWAADMAALINDLEQNPLPASLEVFLQPGPRSEELGAAVAVEMSGREEVEEVRFDRSWLRRLEALLGLARIGGTGLACIVFAAVVFVMASVLRLAVYARRDEIDIMLLVGATPAFVRGPFLVAGFGQGLLASGLALLMVEGVRRAALAYAGSGSLVLLDLVAARPLPLGSSGLVAAVGLVVSLSGAYFAVRRSL
jgi:cell division transport system permease protein